MVCKFGFAVNNRKKDATGAWVDDPCFIDVECFNRGDTGKLAETIGNTCKKGTPVLVDGKLYLDQWEDKNGGGKRSKHKIVADNVQSLEPRPSRGSGNEAPAHTTNTVHTQTQAPSYNPAALTPGGYDDDQTPF